MGILNSSLYSSLAKAFSDFKISLFSDVVLLLTSGYFLLKKTIGISITAWLAENAFQPAMLKWLIMFAGGVILLSLVSKILAMVFNAFPPSSQALVEPEKIAECLDLVNTELASHISKCAGGVVPKISQLRDQHKFDRNLVFVTGALAEHIKESLSHLGINKKKDIFISLYLYDDNEYSLNYMHHFPPKKDWVKSKKIDLTGNRFSEYECAKCMMTTNTTIYVRDKRSYYKGSEKRAKTVRHYMGCKISNEESIFGFLNIEIHNKVVFSSDHEMENFMECNIFPFKLLYEYQFLKQDFCSRFENFDDTFEAQQYEHNGREH